MERSNYLEVARIQGNSSYYLVTAPTGEQDRGCDRSPIKPQYSTNTISRPTRRITNQLEHNA